MEGVAEHAVLLVAGKAVQRNAELGTEVRRPLRLLIFQPGRCQFISGSNCVSASIVVVGGVTGAVASEVLRAKGCLLQRSGCAGMQINGEDRASGNVDFVGNGAVEGRGAEQMLFAVPFLPAGQLQPIFARRDRCFHRLPLPNENPANEFCIRLPHYLEDDMPLLTARNKAQSAVRRRPIEWEQPMSVVWQ